MDFDLHDDDALLVATVSAFSRDRVAPAASEWDDAGRVPPEVLRELGDLGLLGLRVGELEGGAGLSCLAATSVIEALATASASLALVVSAHNFLCIAHLARCGSPAQRTDLMPDLVAGRRIGAWALSEIGSGSDAAALRTSARREGDGWVLDGEKSYVTAGAHAGRVVVFATTEPGDREAGLTAFCVDSGLQGLEVGERPRLLGMRSAGVAHLTLHGVHVGDDRRLGAVGGAFDDARALLHESRIGVAALACGIVQSAVTKAREYALERRQFGRPIAEFQAIQFKLADMETGLQAARLLTRRAAWLCDAGQPYADAASRAKLFAADLASRACSEALQIHGGYGYTREFPVERLLRDAKACQIAEGTGQIQRLLLARALAGRLG